MDAGAGIDHIVDPLREDADVRPQMLEAAMLNVKTWVDPDGNSWDISLHFRGMAAAIPIDPQPGDNEPRLKFRLSENYGLWSSVPYEDYPTDVTELTEEQLHTHWERLRLQQPDLVDHVNGLRLARKFGPLYGEPVSEEECRILVRMFLLERYPNRNFRVEVEGMPSGVAQLRVTWKTIGGGTIAFRVPLSPEALERPREFGSMVLNNLREEVERNPPG